MNKPQFNYNKLLGRIKEKFGSNTAFIEKISMAEPTFYKKIHHGCFTSKEILEFSNLLEIKEDEIVLYFFCTNS